MAVAGDVPRGDAPTDAAHSDPAAVIRRAAERGWTLSTAESLTAGAVVARLVDVPGASAVIAGGAACYSLQAKSRVLGVDPALLAATGAVTAIYDASALEQPRPADRDAVLNGIAALPDPERVLLTGKLWTSVYEVRLVG